MSQLSVLPAPGPDRRNALVAFSLFALFMASYYVFKPVRGSLYIHYLGAENLPQAYLASAGLALIVMAIYNRAFVRVGSMRLLVGTVFGLAACAMIFWLAHVLALVDPVLLSVAFFMWVGVYGALVATLFFSLANDVFDARTGRQVYGFIGIGGIVGAFIGSSATRFVIEHGWLSTENLLPIGAAIVLIALKPMRLLKSATKPAKTSEEAHSKVSRRDGWRWIFGDSYVGSMAALVFLMTFVGTLLDLQYNQVVGQSLIGKGTKTAYFGELYAMVNGLAVLIQILVTGPLHRRYGPLPGLYPLPIIGLAASVVLLIVPNLIAVTIVWSIGMALLYSLNQASKEQLYIPTPEGVKYGAKGYIDVFFFRFGDGSASLLAMAVRGPLGKHPALLTVFCLLLALVWFALVASLGRGYKKRLLALEE